MTREEQIIEAGTYHLCEWRPPKTHGHNMHELAYINRNLSFEAGAKWADENPKDGMVSLDKVEKYLRENIIFYVWTTDLDKREEWFHKFCNAMKK